MMNFVGFHMSLFLVMFFKVVISLCSQFILEVVRGQCIVIIDWDESVKVMSSFWLVYL